MPSEHPLHRLRELCMALPEVTERLSHGEPMAHICRDKGMPAVRTVNDWTHADPEVEEAIASSRRDGWDAIAWRCRETARGRGDSTDDVRRDKLIVETDLKLLAKWDWKRYGDRIRNEITGADGGPVETRYAGYSDAELDKLIADKLAALK